MHGRLSLLISEGKQTGDQGRQGGPWQEGKKMANLQRLRWTVAALVIAVAAALLAVPAHAQTGYQVTLAARECAQYTDIMANLARNNIQESLQDLGPDTVY